jgi:hypothetical protein
MKGPAFPMVVTSECDTKPVFLEGDAPIFPPTLLNTVDPEHPPAAQLRFTITKEGKAISPKVVFASHPQYAAGIAHVMPTWTFSPAILNGEPVDVVAETTWSFRTDAIQPPRPMLF